MRLLLTGFEPFDGADRNPSAEIVAAIAADPPAGVDLRTLVLPVETGVAADRLIEAHGSHRSDVVVMLGEARGRSEITPEVVAINLLDFSIPDNAGRVVTDAPIVEGGPDAHFATLPTARLVEAARAVGVPTSRSLSAGSYLCNEISYRMLHALATDGSTAIAGFIHVPSLPEQASRDRPPFPTMGLDTSVAGIRAMIEAIRDDRAGSA